VTDFGAGVVDAVEPDIGMRALICDVDPVVRSLIRDLVEERSGEVVGETEHGLEAVSLVDRLSPDVVVVDLSLATGSGLDVARELAGRAGGPAVIIFSAFDSGVSAGSGLRVVHKPSFDDLERALDEVVQLTMRGTDRRRRARAVPPPVGRDDDGIDETSEFFRVLVDSMPDDSMIAVCTDGLDVTEAALALRGVLRVQDRVAVRRRWLVALLIGGGESAPHAVIERLRPAIPDIGMRVRCASTGDSPSDAFVALTKD
jgi:CheY-like chemotaxis protein